LNETDKFKIKKDHRKTSLTKLKYLYDTFFNHSVNSWLKKIPVVKFNLKIYYSLIWLNIFFYLHYKKKKEGLKYVINKNKV
jgi:ferric iron reductase protein FhuF